MAGIADYNEKVMLDYVCLGATPTRPAGQGVGLSTAVPNASSGSEIATGSGYARQSPSFAAAASPAGTVSNASTMSFGPFSSGCTISGITVWDQTATGGNLLWYGVLATARTLGAGDSLTIAPGQLVLGVT